MIELVSPARCTACNICVEVCPTGVFAIVPGQIPAIARQQDCQTCFMCELYCPVDALYVAPQPEPQPDVREADLIDQGLLGSYRRSVGWVERQRSAARHDLSYQLLATVR